MPYLGGVFSSIFSTVFIIFIIMTLGYLIGAVTIKGVSLGTAGVLLVAIVYGIIASKIPSFNVGGVDINLFSDAIKSRFSMVSSIGTAMFVTSVGLIAGPKFFRSLNKSFLKYIFMGVIIIGIGGLVTLGFIALDPNLQPEMAVGLMTGALTSTPGLSAAQEVAGDATDLVTTGYGIAYLFGVLGVVFFVQLMPRVLGVNMEEEVKKFVAADTVVIKESSRKLFDVETMGFFAFALAISLGCMIGAIKIPGINFSLGNSGGCLLAGMIVGHFGHMGNINLKIEKSVLNFIRELGLAFFLIGAGVPGGVNFVSNIKLSYFIYGVVITLVPMIAGFLLAKYVFKIDLLNSLGSITGGMTSTPALGALIHTAGTDEVAAAYAATYPVALVCVVLVAKLIILL